MTQPLVVTLPHRLGKAEAIRRLKSGLGAASAQFGAVMQVNEEIWEGDRLTFRITALTQQASGIIDVGETQVRLEIVLPWLLARLAGRVQALVQQKGALMLEKK